MKKVVFYLVLVLFGMYSCQKEDSISNEIDNDDLKSEIGAWHNIAVDLYMNSNNKSKGIDYNDVQNVMVQELVENYPSTFKSDEIEKLISDSEILMNELLKASTSSKSEITRETLVYNTSVVFDFIGTKGYLNRDLTNELIKIATAIENNSITKEEAIIKIEALDNYILNDSDKEFVNTFRQVFYSSRFPFAHRSFVSLSAS